MSYYRVLINGKGISMPSEDGSSTVIGFFTTRAVKAQCAEEAVEKAKAIVKEINEASHS